MMAIHCNVTSEEISLLLSSVVEAVVNSEQRKNPKKAVQHAPRALCCQNLGSPLDCV